MGVLQKPARRACAVAAAAGPSRPGGLAGASPARAQAYPPGGSAFVSSTTLVLVGGHLTFTATLPFAEPVVVDLSLPILPPLPGPSAAAGTQANQTKHQETQATRTLATLMPDAHGRVFGTVTIPSSTVPGDHVLRLATNKGAPTARGHATKDAAQGHGDHVIRAGGRLARGSAARPGPRRTPVRQTAAGRRGDVGRGRPRWLGPVTQGVRTATTEPTKPGQCRELNVGLPFPSAALPKLSD